jgi:ribosomal protein L37E
MEKIICDKCQTQNAFNTKYCSNCGYELQKIAVIREEVIQKIDKKRKLDRAKIIGIIVGTLAAALSSWGVQKLFFNAPSLDKQLMAAASELNKTCPIIVDVETQLDNTVALPDNTFQYNYTLVRLDKSAIDSIKLKANLEPSIIEQLKTNPQMKFFRENNVTMNYLYKDMNKQYIALISIKPEMYQ